MSVNRKWMRYAAIGAGIVAGIELVRRELARRKREEEEEFNFEKMQALCSATHSTPLVMMETDVPKVKKNPFPPPTTPSRGAPPCASPCSTVSPSLISC
jgi:hypothetical protein